MLKYILVFIASLMAATILRADEFDDQLAKYAAKTAATKQSDPPIRIGCECKGACQKCACTSENECLAAKPLPATPAATFLHDCGCPSLSCNCGAGGCHCAPNRQVNRQPAHWVRDGDYWYLYRGSQCLGAMKVNGKQQFFMWNGTDFMTEPCKPPSVPPYRQEQTRVVQSAPVCRS
jgi:hypothetical protein